MRTYNGLPVPFVAATLLDGKSDFRTNDPDLVQQCAKQKRCGICGEHIRTAFFFIGGPSSAAMGLYSDPWMHEQCAELAVAHCPHLSGKKTEYRGKVLGIPAEVMPSRTSILIIKATKVSIKLNRGGAYFQCHDHQVVKTC